MSAVAAKEPAKPRCAKLRIEPDLQPIPGYRLLAPLGKGGFGEVWRVEAPGGILKAVKFVHGAASGGSITAPAMQEFQALRRVKDIRHPYVISIDRIEVIEGTLVIVMELADQSLHDVMVQYQKDGRSGIPREDLLVFLSEAAEALDLMNTQHNLQHLDIKPSNLFLVGNHVKVADFGLARDFNGVSEGRIRSGTLGGITPLYAAPECFQGAISANCDQYSLAITYQQLLTGTLPFDGATARKLALQHTMAEPNLAPLPPADRPIVARALAKRPENRFHSCMEFLEALAMGQSNVDSGRLGSSCGRLTSSRVIRRLRPLEPPPPQDTPPQTKEPCLEQKLEGATDAEICLPAHPSSPAISAARIEIGIDEPLLPPTPGGLGDFVLPGYQFVSCLSSEPPLREVWKAQGPAGRSCILQIITGFDFGEEAKVKQAILRLQGLQHPGLVPLRLVGQQAGQLFVVTEPPEQTLRDRLQQRQREGSRGIPRDELLDCLREAAEILDELQSLCDLRHLGLHPRLLHLANGVVQIAEFGIAHLLWQPAGHPPTRLAARYASPEVLSRRESAFADQFSLAVIYYEMLTGVHPFRGQSVRQAASLRGAENLDCDLLPAFDREPVVRALQRDPRRRFETCVEFVEALLDAGGACRAIESMPPLAHTALYLPQATWQRPAADVGVIVPVNPDVVRSVIRTLTEPFEFQQLGGLRFLHRRGAMLRHRCSAFMPAEMAAYKLEGFRELWNADLACDATGGLVFQLELPRSLWQRLTGRQPRLLIPVRFLPPRSPNAALTEIEIDITPVDCEAEQAQEVLRHWGPKLVESLRESIQAKNEQRSQDRLDFDRPLQVFPVLPSQRLGPPYACQGKDLSISGVGFYLPVRPTAEYICVNVSVEPRSPPLSLLARIIRAQPCANGWWEIGALFLPGGAIALSRN